MSDFSNSNTRRGDGVTARGLIIAILVLVALAFALAIFAGGASDTPDAGPAAPAAQTPEPAPINNN